MSRRRLAFTLVEILVVIAVIGVLVALLLPAIQSTRERARRVQCQSQLGQLILAVHNYESLHGIYPPGTIDAKGPVLNAQLGYHHNWIIQILPHLEFTNTWAAIDKRFGVYHAKQLPVLSVPPKLLDCPSCPAPRGNPCYAGVHHDAEKPIDAADSGMFFLNSSLRIDDVPDGLTHTIFLGEKMPDGWDLHWMSGTRATLRNAGGGINQLKYRVDLPMAVDRLLPAGAEYEFLGPDGEMLIGDAAGMADPAAEPEFPQMVLAPALSPGGPGNPLWVGGFGSAHTTGANFAFGDGSVRLLSDSADVSLLQRFANRRDGLLSPLP
jgi:prepilin-type N-terminal cleavage/methylation domain-containing protein/prepilin-type processing-associated H-X9-DG protein